MNQMSTPPFWGVFREVFEVRLRILAHLWVYKFENSFLGSPNHPEHALRWTKKFPFFLFGLGYFLLGLLRIETV